MAEAAADMPLYLTYRIKCVTVTTTQSISSLTDWIYLSFCCMMIKIKEEPNPAASKKKKRKTGMKNWKCAGAGVLVWWGNATLIKTTAQIQHYCHWIELSVEPPKVRHVNRIRHTLLFHLFLFLLLSLSIYIYICSLVLPHFSWVDNPNSNTCR